MSDVAVHTENLGKLYHIGALQRRNNLYSYKSFRETISNAATTPFRAVRNLIGGAPVRQDLEETRLWALKDVSLQIKQGEIVGVIGRNGAGKSTLLKVLSRITDPTTGHAEIRGRVGSLLEVGTGFHPELSGRDNVYLNGAILGMKRTEIARQFDQIVAFAEVEKFIDTPVKHFSSGMYLRLAFSVAAHLQAEVLFVDEVLAVGDYRFQEKCLGKMHDVATAGRTVFFVSHSMTAIQRLCTRAILMDGGTVIADTNPRDAIAEYTSGTTGNTFAAAPNNDEPSITRAELTLQDRTVLLTVEFQSPRPLVDPVLSFVVYNSLGSPIFGTDNDADTPLPPTGTAAAGRFEVAIPAHALRPDTYLFSLWLGDCYIDHCGQEMALRIDLRDDPGGNLPPQEYGNVYLPTRWTYRALKTD